LSDPKITPSDLVVSSISKIVNKKENKPLPSLKALAIQGESGRDWYKIAHQSIKEYASKRGLTTERVASVVSLTSPRVHVKKNIKLARHYLEEGFVHSSTLPMVRAALAYYEKTGIIRGPKTAAFKEALLGDPKAVVVDVWILRALQTAAGVEPKKLTPKQYQEAAQKIRNLARRLRWPAAETQAAIWTGIRSFLNFKNVDLRINDMFSDSDDSE
jgi:hypothetical protein